MTNFNTATPRAPQPVVDDGTDAEVLRDFIRLCREQKPVGQWPGERVCLAIERAMANERPFRFIAEADMAPQRGHNGRGGDSDRPFSGPTRQPQQGAGTGQIKFNVTVKDGDWEGTFPEWQARYRPIGQQEVDDAMARRLMRALPLGCAGMVDVAAATHALTAALAAHGKEKS